MFTGLIEEIGKIQNIQSESGGKRITINASLIPDDVKIDDSIAVNGVCLTVTALGKKSFTATAVNETLRRSTLNEMRIGQSVNLERALCLKDRLGGHLVQGHVDAVGFVKKIEQDGTGYNVYIDLPVHLMKYIIEKGSVTLNGVSLTVAEKQTNSIRVAVIPHTWQKTTFAEMRQGSKVNIEVDLIGKYVESLFPGNRDTQTGGLSESRLRSLGF